MNTLKGFIGARNIRMDLEWADNNPNTAQDAWHAQARHFRCTLRHGKRRMTVPFYQGAAIEREPTVADVLDCLANDAAGYESARSFEEWASEYGYDADSRKAERTYRVVGRQAKKLRQFLNGAYEELLWETERE